MKLFAKKQGNNQSSSRSSSINTNNNNQSYDDYDDDSSSSPSTTSTGGSGHYPSTNDSMNSYDNNNNSSSNSDQRQQKGAMMSMFKKGLTAGKHKLLQSVGKADKIEHTEDYNVHNNLYKDNVLHYKTVDRIGKRLAKSCEQSANDEQALAEALIKQSEVLQTHQRFNKQVASDHLESLTVLMNSVGQAFKMLGSLHENLQTNISVDYLQTVHEAIEEANICKEIKDDYRECLMEQNVEFNKLKVLKEKSTDLVKVKNQEIIHEKRVKISESVEAMTMKEFDYQEQLLTREYAKSIRELVDAYRNYFLSGAEVLNSLEQELMATTIPPIAERSTRAYSLRELDQVLSKQNNGGANSGDKPAISRAEILEKRRVFGIELEVVNKREHLLMPRVCTELIQYVEDRALDVEGIFRMAASVAGLNTLKRYYDSGKAVDLDKLIAMKEIDIHCVSCLLKLYLRELPTPLLTFELYEPFLQTCSNEELSEDERMRELASLLQQLPHHNMILLDRVLRMLCKVASHHQTNLMTPSNLSIVFGLNLLKSTDSNPLKIAKDNAAVNKVCECLIKSYSGKLSGTFATLAAVAKQEREREIKREIEEEKAQSQNEEPEFTYRHTAPKVIAPENYLPPPPKTVVDNSARKLPAQPPTSSTSTPPTQPSSTPSPYMTQPQSAQYSQPQPQPQPTRYKNALPTRPQPTMTAATTMTTTQQPASPRTTGGMTPVYNLPQQQQQLQQLQQQQPPQQIYPTMHQDFFDYDYEEEEQHFNSSSSYQSPDDFF